MYERKDKLSALSKGIYQRKDKLSAAKVASQIETRSNMLPLIITVQLLLREEVGFFFVTGD